MPDYESAAFKTGRRTVSTDDMSSGRKKHKEEKLPAKMQAEMQQLDRAEREVALERMMPPRIIEPRCRVCMHPYRDFIEAMLVRGQSYKSIGERVQPPVDRRGISNHFKNHMDLQDAAMRAILEEEADLQAQDYETGLRGAITKRGVMEIALRKGYEDIVNEVTTVEPRDLIQIAKLLAEMDSHQHQVSVDEMRAQVAIFIQAIKDVLDPEDQGRIAQRVKELRRHEGFGTEFERVMESSPALPVEAEVVEDDESL